MADLKRFKDAQAGIYDKVLQELRAGKKQSHWMWFIFPQLAGLGSSITSERYAIHSLNEAREYCADAVLYDRLALCCDLMLKHKNQSARDVLGYPDHLKLRSSMTLFAKADPEDPIFQEVLDAFFDGAPDPLTLEILEYKEC